MTDENLLDAKTAFQNAIWALIDPPCRYLQLRRAIPGEQGTGHGPARSMPPLWVDAVDRLRDIDTTISEWQAAVHPNFIGPLQPHIARLKCSEPVTITRLHHLEQRTWRPQDTPQLRDRAHQLEQWAIKIDHLLDPPRVKTISAPCPACQATHAYRRDDTGTDIRVPALQLVAGVGCSCLVCKATWAPEYYLHLCRVLGFDLPAGILE